MIRDADILENRLQAVMELPWVIPALIIVEMTEEDLDHLDAAFDHPHYWSTLNEIVTRIKEAS